MPECPREARTASPVTDTVRLGKRDREWGWEAGPANTRSCEKRSPFLHPPTYPSIHPSIPASTHHSAPLNILGRQNIWKLFVKKEKIRIVGERTASMRRWRETVEVCLGVTGLRGAFSCRVVSEACRVLRLFWLTVFILRTKTSDTHIDMCVYLCSCVLVSVWWAPDRPENVLFCFLAIVAGKFKNSAATFTKITRN